jgi:hypothetical protein
MRSTALAVALGTAEFLSAGQHMNVSVCNLHGVRESIVADAKAGTEAVFRSAGIDIVWKDCGEFSPPDSQESGSWFVIRLRNDKPPRTIGPASLDVMGRAFLSDRAGYMADAYYQAIRDVAGQYQGEAAGELLGFVIAHELGHLLLGPGHAPGGVMRGGWGLREMEALRKRWLTFNKNEVPRIRNELESRASKGDVVTAAK